VRRLPQVIPWLADRIALDVHPDQRGFDLKPIFSREDSDVERTHSRFAK
jgi:hypothetical protein